MIRALRVRARKCVGSLELPVTQGLSSARDTGWLAAVTPWLLPCVRLMVTGVVWGAVSWSQSENTVSKWVAE